MTQKTKPACQGYLASRFCNMEHLFQCNASSLARGQMMVVMQMEGAVYHIGGKCNGLLLKSEMRTSHKNVMGTWFKEIII